MAAGQQALSYGPWIWLPLRCFFQVILPKKVFLTWAVVGECPIICAPSRTARMFFANIRQHILDAQSGTLFNEPRLLLMEELREPRNYFSLLRAIAQGRTRLNDIAQGAGIGDVTTAVILIFSSK